MNDSIDFLDIETIHYATLSWFWTGKSLYDFDYHIKVNDGVQKKAKVIEQKYDVMINTSFRSQSEGIQFSGTSLEDVRFAGIELAEYLATFSEIVPVYKRIL